MNRYIVEFDKNISETEKLTIIQSVNAIHVSNIFQNFELIECDTDVFELLKQHDTVITIELDGLCEAQDAEAADFPNHILNILNNAHSHGYKGDFDANEQYERGSGTSYSAPVVTGIIAILKQRFPHFAFDEIYRLLKDYAVVVGDGNVNYYGNGLVTMPDMSKISLMEKVYYKGMESKLENFLYLIK